MENNLGLIIGVPTGLGLCLIGFLICIAYCGISAAWHSWRDNRAAAQNASDYYRGTASTNLRTTPNPSTVQGNSSYPPSYFEPSTDTLQRGATIPMSEFSVHDDTTIYPDENTSHM